MTSLDVVDLNPTIKSTGLFGSLSCRLVEPILSNYFCCFYLLLYSPFQLLITVFNYGFYNEFKIYELLRSCLLLLYYRLED